MLKCICVADVRVDVREVSVRKQRQDIPVEALDRRDRRTFGREEHAMWHGLAQWHVGFLVSNYLKTQLFMPGWPMARYFLGYKD